MEEVGSEMGGEEVLKAGRINFLVMKMERIVAKIKNAGMGKM